MDQSAEVSAAAESPESAVHVPEALTLDVRIGDYLPDFFQPAWELFQQYPVALGLLILLLGYLLGKALQWLVTKSLQRITAKTKTNNPNSESRNTRQNLLNFLNLIDSNCICP